MLVAAKRAGGERLDRRRGGQRLGDAVVDEELLGLEVGEDEGGERGGAESGEADEPAVTVQAHAPPQTCAGRRGVTARGRVTRCRRAGTWVAMPLTHPTRVEGYDAIRLRSASAHLDATFVPTAGMVGASLRDGGEELLGRGLGVHCYARGGTTMGIPLLHPWANRLAADEYRVNGTAVRLRPDSPLVARDEHGLPIHGLLGGSPHWALRHSNGNGDGRMGALGRARLRRPSRAPRGVPVPPPPRARRRAAPAHADRAHDA